MDREIPEQHANLLRNMVGLGEFDSVPPKLAEAYWEFKRVSARISSGPTPSDLIWMCVNTGYGKEKKPGDDKQPTIAQLWKKRKIKAHAPVFVQWRGEEQEAALIRVNANGELRVEFPDGTEHTVAADKVRLAELVEC